MRDDRDVAGLGKPRAGAAFAGGRTPTDRELFDAYPFGERAYWPYKCWLEQVKCWKQYRAGKPPAVARTKKVEPVPEGQEALF